MSCLELTLQLQMQKSNKLIGNLLNFIKRNYRKMILKYHPDKNKDDP